MFLSMFNASVDKSPFGDFWFTPVGQNTMSGQRVTPDSAMQVTAVFACVAVLSESFAILPPVLYRQNGRKKEKVTDHWLYKLIAKRPNRYQNAFEWREMCQGHLVLRGNCYNRIIANSRGEITELLPINPDSVTITVKSDGDYSYLIKNRDGSQTTFSREEIWHIKGLAPDIYQGYSPIAIARDSIGVALSAQAYGAKFFSNDAKPNGGWIEFPGQFKDTEAKKIFRESWQSMQGGGNRGKTAVLDMGMQYHDIGVSNVDAQFLETRKFSIEEIARLFRVPPHRIGHLERSTNNNIEHQGLEFVTYTMTPWAERWEAAIEADLLPDDSDLEIEFDFNRLLRGDSKARAAYYHFGVLDGWLTRNEPRIAEGLDPIDGLDEPLRPLNMVPEDEADELDDANEAIEEPGEQKQEKQE
ncbi:MAG: phage portal protein [Negativicutes bacterium]|jgi:HK97 family phage portal protein